MILCHDVIWLSKYSSTYCMRERGHAGKHNIENCEPVEEKPDYNLPLSGGPKRIKEKKEERNVDTSSSGIAN